MILNFPFVVGIMCLQLCQTAQASRFKSSLYELAKDCPGEPKENSIDSLFDYDLDWSYDTDAYLFNGTATFLKDIDPNQKIHLYVDILRKYRGDWHNTWYSINQEDFCGHFLDPEQLWYPLVKDFNGDNRACPPKKGTIYEFLNKEVSIFLDTSRDGIANVFKYVVTLESKEGKMCIEMEMFNEEI